MNTVQQRQTCPSVWRGVFLKTLISLWALCILRSSDLLHPPQTKRLSSFFSQMEPLPSQLLLMIFACFLPPLVCDETATDDLPLGERVKMFKNLGACRSVCRRWREVVEEIPSLFSREAHVIEGDQVSKVGSRALGSEYVKRPYVWGVSNGFLAVFPDVTHASWPCQIPIHIPLDDISYPSPNI